MKDGTVLISTAGRMLDRYKVIFKPLMVIILCAALIDAANILLSYYKLEFIWHTLFDSMSVMFSIVIFLSTYHAFTHTKRVRTITLCLIFLVVAILDTVHMLAYLEVEKLNQPDYFFAQTAYFAGRLIKSAGLIVFALIGVDAVTTIRRNSIVIPTILAAVIGILGIYFLIANNIGSICTILESFYSSPPGNPVINYFGLRWLIIICYFLAAVLLAREYLKQHEKHIGFIVLSIVCSISSHFLYELSPEVGHSFNYAALLLRVGAGYLLFRAIFFCYVQKPYSELDLAREKLEEHTENLEALITEKTFEIGRVNEKLLSDIEIAKNIQMKMIPASHFCLKGMEFYVEYRPCQALGGDFCRVIRVDEENIGIYIGDVSGHGVRAAMLTMFVNQTIASAVQKDNLTGRYDLSAPAQVQRMVYDAFNYSSFDEDMYIGLFYAVYNLRTKDFRFCSAGMNTIPIVFNSGGTAKYLKTGGFPICKLPGLVPGDFEDKLLKLNTGDRILLYTDGLVDSEDLLGSRYGRDKLEKLIAENSGNSLDRIVESIVCDLKQFTCQDRFNDDVSFILLEAK